MSIEKLDFDKIKNEKLPFTIILNSVIQNIKDAKAFMVWTYLYSHSGDWNVIKEHLKNHFGFGDDALKDIFSYLNRCKLISYFRERKADGTLGKNNIYVLNGTEFDKEIPFKISKRVKITPVVKTGGLETEPAVSTTGVKTTRVENHSSGFRGLLNKDKYEINNFYQRYITSNKERWTQFNQLLQGLLTMKKIIKLPIEALLLLSFEENGCLKVEGIEICNSAF